MQAVNLTCHTDRTQITLTGTLDVSGNRAACEALSEALTRSLPLEVHAADLERLDAAGLQLLLVFVQTAKQHDQALRWHSVSASLSASAELLGLARALELPA